jgi:cytochrome c oxidase subunit III
MEHAVVDEPKLHMGLPLPDGKLAIWLFLVTEIMFFTGLIGTYLILRNGTPTDMNPWPRPHDVHLAEWMGAVNTFVLICSSLTVVLAHLALSKKDVKRATQFIGVTLALGCVFLVIKGFEYQAKFSHEILPGRIFEKFEGPNGGPNGQRFTRHVEEQLKEIVAEPEHHGANEEAVTAWKSFLAEVEVDKKNKKTAELVTETEKGRTAAVDKIKKELEKDGPEKIAVAVRAEYDKTDKKIAEYKEKTAKEIEIERKALATGEKTKSIAPVADSWALLQKLPSLSPKEINLEILGSDSEHIKPCDLEVLPNGKLYVVKEGLLEKHPDLHVSNAISFGNMWASCYFAMTGFHAIHVLGGLVVFVIMLVMAWRGNFKPHHEGMVELTGLYWHFVDIVWIFLFPLLYLV